MTVQQSTNRTRKDFSLHDGSALTQEELDALEKEVHPSKARILGLSVAAAAILGGVAAGITAQIAPAPQPADYHFAAEGALAPAAHHTAEIDDPDNVLSEEDEARLMRESEHLPIPAVVQQLHYVVFAHNDDNVNDTMENYLRDEHPELIGTDYFADGTLFIGVGLDPRQSFVFAGNDVADALQLWEGRHQDDTTDAIKPGVKDNNIPAGLLAGAKTAVDIDKLGDAAYTEAASDRRWGIGALGVGTGALALATGGIGGGFRRRKAKRAAQARAEFRLVSEDFGTLASRLDEIDIRAHSLSSPFADATMRQQWEEVRDRFLAIHKKVDKLEGLRSTSPDRDFVAHSNEITDAARTTRELSFAEKNIDILFKLEHGDVTVRRAEVQALREDLMDALLQEDDADSGIYRELTSIRARLESLEKDVDSSDFLDKFIVALRDYQTVLEHLKDERFTNLTDDPTPLRAPALYEPGYRPGYGVSSFVPYWALSAWHVDNTAHSSGSDSFGGGSNVTTFSSGFSGAGGSSSF